MSTNRRDSGVKESLLETRLRQFLEMAAIWESGRQPECLGVCGTRLQTRYAIDDFFKQMTGEGETGRAVGAAVFVAVAGREERIVRTRLLTRLAYMVCACTRGRRLPQEEQFGHLGPFLAHLMPEQAPWVVAWAEDLDTDDPALGLERQPIAVIRGAFLSPEFPLPVVLPFWELAALSERFPLRLFREPCPADDGAIFASWHLRAFGGLLEAVSARARRKFAGAIAAAREKRVFEIGPDIRFGTSRTVPATAEERRRALQGIAGFMGQHRAEVEEIFAAA